MLTDSSCLTRPLAFSLESLSHSPPQERLLPMARSQLSSPVKSLQEIESQKIMCIPVLGFGSLESQDYRGSEKPALHSTDEETEAERGADLPQAPLLVKAEQKLEARPLSARLASRFPSQTFSMDFPESLSSTLVSSHDPGSMETVFHSARGRQEAGYNCAQNQCWGEEVCHGPLLLFWEKVDPPPLIAPKVRRGELASFVKSSPSVARVGLGSPE